jgi:hypothetical protein
MAPFFGEGGIDPLAEPRFLGPPAQAFGVQQLADPAALDRDPLLLMQIGGQAVERPAPEWQSEVRLVAITVPISPGV